MSWKDLVRLNFQEGGLPSLIDCVKKMTSTQIYFRMSSKFYGTILFMVSTIKWESCPQRTPNLLKLDFINEKRRPRDRHCNRWIVLDGFLLLGFRTSVSDISEAGCDRGLCATSIKYATNSSKQWELLSKGVTSLKTASFHKPFLLAHGCPLPLSFLL